MSPESQQAWLIPGDAIDVSFFVQREGGVVVPRDALVFGVTKVQVFRVIEGDKVEPVDVTVLARNAQAALVEAKDLKPNDRVVVRGNERLRPGQPVAVGSASPP